MCQATVYLGDEEVAREVTGMTLVEDGVRLTSFFEDPQVVHGRVLQVDFLKHRVHLEPLEDDE
jgi:predicted RNA-binding protein